MTALDQPTQRLTPAQAQSAFDQLSIKFKSSVVGSAYAHIISLLDSAGQAPLTAVLTALFPSYETDRARTALSSQVINRRPRNKAGASPLRLVVSRAARVGERPQFVWFESDPTSQAQHLPDSPRYDSRQFYEAQAQSATEQQITAHLRSADVQAQFNNAHSDSETYEKKLRGSVDPHYENSDATKSDTMRESSDATLGKRVNTLEALFDWACANDAKHPKQPQHRLLALLGDYGTGKTSHTRQFARILNGQVSDARWTAHQTTDQARGQSSPQAEYIDLAILQAADNLRDLYLVDILAIANADRAQESVNAQHIELAKQQLQRARAGELILVFDGLDELLTGQRDGLSSIFDRLLKVLESDPSTPTQPSRARIIVSCRTHYFRDMSEQHSFFMTRQRGLASSNDYLCLTLLPWAETTIENYIHRRLSAAAAKSFLTLIDTVYNLQQLASRPVLLAMMSEHIGDLLRAAEKGAAITAEKVYGIVVGAWINRDQGKHQLIAYHKPLLMGALAAQVWSQGGSSRIGVQQLDEWLVSTVPTLFGTYYENAKPQDWRNYQDDLRTATFIVRPGSDEFAFAHRSFLEYFLARFVCDLLERIVEKQIDLPSAHRLLPRLALNAEAHHFLSELWAAQTQHRGAPAMQARAHALWQLLQHDTDPQAQTPTAEPTPAPPQHAMLWQAALVLVQQHNIPTAAPDNRPLNLRGLDFSHQQWADFSLVGLPPLDLRGASLLCLRAHRVAFGAVLCDAQTNWAQALLRDCEAGQIAWGDSDRGGLIVRSGALAWPPPAVLMDAADGGSAAHAAPSVKAPPTRPRPALQGPWTGIGGHSGTVKNVAFSPDGERVLTGGGDKTARLWEASSGREMRRFEGHSDWVTSVAFSPDGERVLTGEEDGEVRLWEASSGRKMRRFEGHSGGVNSVAFSPDGERVLTGGENGEVRLWEASSGRKMRRFEGHSGGVNSVAFSPDGERVLTGGDDTTARLWEASSGRELRRFEGHSGGVNSVAFSPDGERVLTGGDDTTARLWEASSGREMRRFEGHSGQVWSVAFSPDGERVLTGGGDKTARLWQASSGREMRRFEDHSGWVWSVAFSPDGERVLTGGGDKTARLWQASSGREMRRFEDHSGWVWSVAFSPDGERVLTGGENGEVRLWEASSGRELRRFEGHSGGVNSVTFSPDGERVLTGGENGEVRLWEASSGRELRRFEGHSGGVNSVTFSPDGERVLTGGEGGEVRLWEASSGREMRHFEGHSGQVWSVAFSPDGELVLTGGGDKTARLWEASNGRALRRFKGHSGLVNSVAFSPDGERVLTGGDDTTARLWEASSGRALRRFKGHSGWVMSVAFSPDGERVLTGGEDGEVRLWQASSGRALRRLEGHSGSATSVAFSPDGERVLTGGSDGTARLWWPEREKDTAIHDTALTPAAKEGAAGGTEGASGQYLSTRVLALLRAAVGNKGASEQNPEKMLCRWLVTGRNGSSTALFNAAGDLLDADEEAADTWLFTLASGRPEPLELAPLASR